MLAGYITATTVDLAVAKRVKGELQLVNRASYVNKDFSDFDGILNHYLKKQNEPVSGGCLGVAGPVIDNEVIATNIPWEISGSDIGERFSFDKIRLVNDLVATAQGLFELKPHKFFTINRGSKKAGGNIGLIAAGTGLGEALIYFDGEKARHYASEGGHAGFAPGTQLEAELWQYLYAELGNVEAEDIVSLRGLERIYHFLIDTGSADTADWFKAAPDRPARIIEMALSGQDEIAVRALDIFIDCYASEAANLAMKGMTLGGIYLGGLIAPQIMTMLDKGRFMERFVKNGKMVRILARMPVRLIIENKTALIGAASLALEM
jgi:glucokinase